MINKYVLVILACFFKQCLSRRPVYNRPINPSPISSEVWIALGFMFVPNLGGWLSYLIKTVMLASPTRTQWVLNLKLLKYNLPEWAMVVAWTVLYSSMGYASYVVYRDCGGFTSLAITPLTLYGYHLLLNWTWSPVYYGFCKTNIGFFHFLFLDAVALACTVSFFLVNMYTIYAMVPNLIFLVYLTILSYMMWKNNPGYTVEVLQITKKMVYK